MGADEVVEEDEHGNEVVGRSEGCKALFRFVPGLELLVKALNEVVGDVVVEALDADVLYPMQRLDRHPVSVVAVGDNGLGLAQRLHGLQDGKGLGTVPVRAEVEAEDEPGFAVQNEPEVVFLSLDFDHGLISVPLVRIEIERRDELQGDVLEHGGEAGTPVADGRVGYLDIHHGAQDQGDIAERVLAQVEHGQGRENHMDRIAHPLEIRLPKEPGHGRRCDCCRLGHEHGVVTLLVAAAVMAVVFPIMVQEGGFSAHRAGRVNFRPRTARVPRQRIRRELMPTLLALVFLVTMFIFSVAIKVRFVVAFRAAHLV